MDGQEKISVLVAHHEPVVRFGLAEIIRLHPQMRICGQAGTVAEMQEICAQLEPSVIIFEPGMDTSGADLLVDLPHWSPKARLVVFTANEDTTSMQRAFSSGVVGYVTRRDAIKDLVTAVVNAAEGNRHIGPHLSLLLLDELACGSMKVEGSSAGDLSDRELQVFQLIGQGKSTREVASDLQVTPKTIETRRQRIKTKLRLRSGAELQQRAALYVNSSSR